MVVRSRTLAPALFALAALVSLSDVASAQKSPRLSWNVSIGVPHRPAPSIHIRGARRGPIFPACAPTRVWVPGHYQRVAREHWIPARTQRVWVAPVIETRCDLWGRRYSVEVAPGHWRDVVGPGHFERREERVWQPGRWELRG